MKRGIAVGWAATLLGAWAALAGPAAAQAGAAPRQVAPMWGTAAECPALVARLKRELAARQAEAHLQASAWFESGACVEHSEARAAEFLEEAARLGSTVAQRRMAMRFARGRGVVQSYATAGGWLTGKGATDEALEPWDYSIGYAYAVAAAVRESMLVPVDALPEKLDVPLVLSVSAQRPLPVLLRLTGEGAAAREGLRAPLAAAVQVAASRALEALLPPDPKLLVRASVSLPLLLRVGGNGQVDLVDQEPVLR